MATADELHLLPGEIVKVGNGISYRAVRKGNLVLTFSFQIKGEGPRARVLRLDDYGVEIEYLEPCFIAGEEYPVGTLEYINRNIDCFRKDIAWMN